MFYLHYFTVFNLHEVRSYNCLTIILQIFETLINWFKSSQLSKNTLFKNQLAREYLQVFCFIHRNIKACAVNKTIYILKYITNERRWHLFDGRHYARKAAAALLADKSTRKRAQKERRQAIIIYIGCQDGSPKTTITAVGERDELLPFHHRRHLTTVRGNTNFLLTLFIIETRFPLFPHLLPREFWLNT